MVRVATVAVGAWLALSGCDPARNDEPERQARWDRTTGVFDTFSPDECTCSRLRILTTTYTFNCSPGDLFFKGGAPSFILDLPDTRRSNERELTAADTLAGINGTVAVEYESSTPIPDARGEPFTTTKYRPLWIHHLVVEDAKTCAEDGTCTTWPTSSIHGGFFWCRDEALLAGGS